jgi:tripeptidyl-peptidase-1
MAITAYQQHEQAHLSHLLNLFNRVGRGYPDVSAQGYAYLTVVEGQVHAVYGTSAAAPVFASIVTLINNERLQMGKRPVGFVNPALYANPEVMNDVVSGANEGCGVDPAFQATVGWDPVTGLGSPDYQRMRNLFIRLP